MAKNTTPSFVLARRLPLDKYQYDRQEKILGACNKLYNTAARHCRAQTEELFKDAWFQYSLKKYREAVDEQDSRDWGGEAGACIEAYGLSEYAIHAYIGIGRARAYQGCIGANIAQKLGTALYASVRKAVFAGTQVHYRKKGQTDSYEDKKAGTGVIYHPEADDVRINKKAYPLKPVRGTDLYMQEAMGRRIKYCRVVRKPFKERYKYFVQFVLEGAPPDKSEAYPFGRHKHTLGKGMGGVDEGVSTCSFYTGTAADFVVLADGVEKYEAAILAAAKKYERRCRLNNQDCYNPDGTIRKGARFKNRTKGMQRALMELKNAYRLKAVFVNQEHDILANCIVSCCDAVVKEPMDYRALARRAGGQAERQDKMSMAKKKDGTARPVRKFKRKKRFGTSIGRRSPGLLNQKLEQKVTARGGSFLDVNLREYKASQYGHVTQEAVKAGLSGRSKTVGGQRVQRDLYSSFLLYAARDGSHINFVLCAQEFGRFLERQARVVAKMIVTGDKTGNFGLKDFLKAAGNRADAQTA